MSNQFTPGISQEEREAAANHAADLDRAARFLRRYSDSTSWERIEDINIVRKGYERENAELRQRIEELEAEVILQRKILRDARLLATHINTRDGIWLLNAAKLLINRIDTE